jgi:hypothetical protein
MISVDAAGVLAQLIPVGLLVLALEGRVLRIDADAGRVYRGWQILVASVSGIALVLGISAISLCVISVASNVPLDGGKSVFVAVAGYILANAVGFVLGTAFANQIKTR